MSAEQSTKAEFLRGIWAGLPLLLGFLPFALVLGAQAIQKDLSIFEITLMTGLSFAGSSDFAAIQVWTTPPQTFLLVAMTFLINSRYILMSASITPFIQHLPKRKTLPILFLLSDAIWAMSLSDSQKRLARGLPVGFSMPYYLGTGFTFYFSWVAFTALGAMIGPLIGDLSTLGFHMTIPAVFLVMMRSMWKGWKRSRPWLVSLIVAACTYLWVPGAWYVITGAIAGMIAAYFLTEQA